MKKCSSGKNPDQDNKENTAEQKLSKAERAHISRGRIFNVMLMWAPEYTYDFLIEERSGYGVWSLFPEQLSAKVWRVLESGSNTCAPFDSLLMTLGRLYNHLEEVVKHVILDCQRLEIRRRTLFKTSQPDEEFDVSIGQNRLDLFEGIGVLSQGKDYYQKCRMAPEKPALMARRLWVLSHCLIFQFELNMRSTVQKCMAIIVALLRETNRISGINLH
ncbi:hypothetical protein J6590_011497 [Homalodisca vitripennis]|nr:hypothetical protein J6590_011497 [Homalodisca vitripennis]